MASGVEPDAEAIRNERVELTAGFVDRMAGACFAAGVVAPAAAAVFGLTGPGTSLSTLTIVLGATIFLLISPGLHLMARDLLKGLIRRTTSRFSPSSSFRSLRWQWDGV